MPLECASCARGNGGPSAIAKELKVGRTSVYRALAEA